MSFRYDNSTRSITGQALSGVSVAILTQPAVTTTQPGSPLATIFAASTSNAPALTTASWAAGFITFALASVPSDVVVGAYLSVTGVNPTGYNGIWLINAVSGLNVKVTNTNGTLIGVSPGTYVSGGTVATSVLPNPFLTDQLGNFFFYAAAGIYTIQLYGSALPNQLILADQNVVAGGGAGSVTSVSLSMPAEFSVAGSPVSTAGTLAVTKANENANTVWAGPTGGGPAAPAFRALVAADLTGVAGTVSSVAMTATVPNDIITSAVGGSPVTTSGTLALTLTKVNQNANIVFAGPTGGGAAPPTFRALVSADLPASGLPAFSALTSGTNTTAAMIVGAGASFASIPEVDIGAVGTPGILGLVGTTSGKATLTAPAVAGTTSNPIVSSNAFSIPSAAPGVAMLVFAGTGGTGFNSVGSNVEFTWQGFRIALFSNTGIQGTTGNVFGWSNSPTNPSAAADTGLSRDAAGIVDVGNGVSGDKSGSMKMTNLSLLGLVPLYNNIATVSNGVPSEYATVDLTAQTSPVAATNLYTPAATGMFRISAYLKITTTGTSPVLGPVTITYNDGTDNVAQSVVMAMQTQAGANATSNNGNTTTSVLSGILVIFARLGVAIQYAIALTGTVGAAQYEAHLKLEAL